jgi:hypothetical protein
VRVQRIRIPVTDEKEKRFVSVCFALLGAFASEKASSCVCPSACIRAILTGRIFVKFHILDFTEICWQMPILVKIGQKITGMIYECVYTCMISHHDWFP